MYSDTGGYLPTRSGTFLELKGSSMIDKTPTANCVVCGLDHANPVTRDEVREAFKVDFPHSTIETPFGPMILKAADLFKQTEGYAKAGPGEYWCGVCKTGHPSNTVCPDAGPEDEFGPLQSVREAASEDPWETTFSAQDANTMYNAILTFASSAAKLGKGESAQNMLKVASKLLSSGAMVYGLSVTPF
jgi:hypothetical protein